MGIIIKFVLKNIYEKKFRTFLIVFAIMLSSALYFASSAISGTMVKMYLERMKQFYGTSEIMVTSNEKSPTGFIDINNANQFKADMDYIIGITQGGGSYSPGKNENINISLQGVNLEEVKRMTRLSLAQQLNLYPFEGRKVIINTITAEKYHLKTGDLLVLKMNGVLQRFTIAAIANPVGTFVQNDTNIMAVVPQNTMNSIYGVRGKSTVLLLKTKDPARIKEMIGKLAKEYPRYTVREPFSKEDLQKETQSMSTPFMLMTIIVSFMSVFIIFSSFKVLTVERLPVIGTFRSIGATRKMTDWIMLAESTLYGIIGGAFGCALGVGILYLMAKNSIMSTYDSNIKAAIDFSSSTLISTFIMAVLLCFVSSVLPIIRVSKIPVKEIVLNAIEKKSKKRKWKPVAGLLLLFTAIFLPRIAPDGLAILIDALCMLFAVISVVLLIPQITGVFIKFFERVYTFIFGNIGILAAKNLRENKSILNSISLLTIGISSLLMINTVSYSVLTQVSSYFTKNSRFEVYMYLWGADKNILPSIRTTEGVLDVNGGYEIYGTELAGTTTKLDGLYGVNSAKYLDFNRLNLPDGGKELMLKLEEDRNILLGSTMKKKLNIDIGDTITLKFKPGDKTYKVIGFVDTIDYGGKCGFISDKYVKSDLREKFFSNIQIKTTGDPNSVVKALKSKFALRQPWVMSMKELEKMNLDGNRQMFSQLQGFSILTLLIGILGIFNNLMLSFIERKRSLAMYRSTGMSKAQILKMIFIEALTGGIVGGVVGVIAGALMVAVVPYVMVAIDEPMPISTSPGILLTGFFAGVAIMLVSSISPAVKSSKLNIITSLKYE